MEFASPNFKQLFCAHYGCSEADYPVQALFRLVHREAQVLARMVWKVSPQFFTADLEILETVGRDESRERVFQLAKRLEEEYRRRNSFGCVRQACLLWISPKQLRFTALRLWAKDSIPETPAFRRRRTAPYRTRLR